MKTRQLLAFAAFIAVASSQSAPADQEFDDGQPRDGHDVPTFVNIYTHPKTGFSCEGRNAGEYYADPETKCAVYYICLANQYGKLSPTSFACPNGTIFSQATRVCAGYESVHCQLSSRFYDSVHGHIDSKDKDPKQFAPTVRVASAPWIQNERNNRNNHRDNRDRLREETRVAVQNAGRQSQAAHVHSPAAQPAALPTAGSSRRVPQRLVNVPTTTTAAPTTRNTQPEVVEYEYVDYDIPSQPQANNQNNPPSLNPTPNPLPNESSRIRNRRSPRRKGTLPSIPADFIVTPTHFTPTISDFTCADKISGLAYADVLNQCRMFHLCLPLSKGKLRDHQMFCKEGEGYNQEKGACQNLSTFDCKQSEKFFILNKLSSEDGRRKWPASWEKKQFNAKRIVH